MVTPVHASITHLIEYDTGSSPWGSSDRGVVVPEVGAVVDGSPLEVEVGDGGADTPFCWERKNLLISSLCVSGALDSTDLSAG